MRKQITTKRIAIIFLLSLVLGFAGLYLVSPEAPLNLSRYHLVNWSLPFVTICIIMALTNLLTPAVRILILCREQVFPISYFTALKVTLTTNLASALTPGRAGGAPIIALALRHLGLPLGRGLNVTMQLIILDLIFYTWALPVCLIYLLGVTHISLPPEIEVLITVTISITVIIMTFAVLGLILYPKVIVRLLLWLARMRLLRHTGIKLKKIAKDYYRSVRLFKRMKFRTWFSIQFITAFGWLSNYLLLWGLLGLYGILTNPLETVAGLTIITFSSNFVPTPGGSGFMEAAVGFSTDLSRAGVFAAPLVVWRLITYYLIFVVGPLATWSLYHIPNRSSASDSRPN